MIGIFDSGVGGLSILREFRKALPNADFAYFGDTANVPYGGRRREEIVELSTQALDELLRAIQELVVPRVVVPDLVVVACNTITSSAIMELRAAHPEIPIVGVVPVLRTAAARTKVGRIAVLSTTATLQSNSYQELKRRFAQNVEVLELALPEWVEIVEEGEDYPGRSSDRPPLPVTSTGHALEKEGRIVAQSVREVSAKIRQFGADVVVMGCTHFVFLKEPLEKALDNVAVLDSGAAVARQAVRVLTANGKLPTPHYESFGFKYGAREPGRSGSVKYFCSGDVERFERVAGRLMGEGSPHHSSLHSSGARSSLPLVASRFGRRVLGDTSLG